MNDLKDISETLREAYWEYYVQEPLSYMQDSCFDSRKCYDDCFREGSPILLLPTPNIFWLIPVPKTWGVYLGAYEERLLNVGGKIMAGNPWYSKITYIGHIAAILVKHDSMLKYYLYKFPHWVSAAWALGGLIGLKARCIARCANSAAEVLGTFTIDYNSIYAQHN